MAELYRAVAEVDAVRVTTRFRADADALGGAFDAAVLLPNSFGAALQVWLSRIPERWGYATDGRGPLLTRAPRVPPQVRGRSQVYYYRAMLAGAGLRVSATPDVSLACPPEWSAGARRLLGDDEGAPWIATTPAPPSARPSAGCPSGSPPWETRSPDAARAWPSWVGPPSGRSAKPSRPG